MLYYGEKQPCSRRQKGVAIKILHLIWAFNVGGAESMLVDIMNEQSKNHDVHLMIVNQLESETLVNQIDPKIRIHRILRKPGSRNLAKLIHCNLKIFNIDPDVIHCHNHDLVRFVPLVKIKRHKLFLTIHSTGIPTNNFSKYCRLFAISKTVQKNILNRSQSKGIVVYNGIITDLIKVKNDYPKEIVRLVQIGRLYIQQKGQDIMIEALAHIVNSKKIKTISIDFIGTGESELQLRQLARKLNIQNYCNFRGLKSRGWIYENLCSYDLLIQPSRCEGFGLTVAEAMAAKVPVLVSDQEGPMEIIGNGKYGYSFRTGDSLDLAEKISDIKKKNDSKELQEKLSAGRIRVAKLYDIRQTAAAYISQYEN